MINLKKFQASRLYTETLLGRLLKVEYNIPSSKLSSRFLEVVRRAISLDFQAEMPVVVFSLDANYTVQNRHTHEVQFRKSQLYKKSALKSHLRFFNNANFVSRVKNRTKSIRLIREMYGSEYHYPWQMCKLLSVVVTVQSIVGKNHHTLSEQMDLN